MIGLLSIVWLSWKLTPSAILVTHFLFPWDLLPSLFRFIIIEVCFDSPLKAVKILWMLDRPLTFLQQYLNLLKLIIQFFLEISSILVPRFIRIFFRVWISRWSQPLLPYLSKSTIFLFRHLWFLELGFPQVNRFFFLQALIEVKLSPSILLLFFLSLILSFSPIFLNLPIELFSIPMLSLQLGLMLRRKKIFHGRLRYVIFMRRISVFLPYESYWHAIQ